MNADAIVFIAFSVLAVTLLATNWFWARQNQRLVDKLMSRNYADYEQATALGKPQPPAKPEMVMLDDQREDLQALNGMLVR